MSTLEKTISMIENLPEADLLKIQDFIKKFFGQHECETAHKNCRKRNCRWLLQRSTKGI